MQRKMSTVITVIFTPAVTGLMSNNFIQALHLTDFSWETDNIKPDVQLYIQLYLVPSVSVLTCHAAS